MFAPATTFWNEEAPLHVVKIDRNARDEFGIYMHEIDTERQSDAMYIDWLFNGDDLRYEDPGSAAWYDDMAQSWFPDEESQLSLDHIMDGLGCHELADCAQCANHAEYLEMKYWNSFGADDGAYDEAIRFHEEDIAWREHDRVSLSNDGYISLVAELGLDD